MSGDAAPVIDVAALRADITAAGETIAAIHRACTQTGFFVVTGHGLDDALAAMFDAATTFFDQPDEVKASVAMVDGEGFVPVGTAPLDPRMGPEAKERLDLGLQPTDRWPALPGFADTARRFQREALALAADLLAGLAVALELDPSFFAARMRAPQCVLRLMHYLPAPVGQPTAGPHTDYGAITLLATDGVAGLEVRLADGSWAPVSAPPGSLVINLGDMLARWTNGRYASTVHRVVGQPQHRWSIPFFVNPDPDTVVECLPSCVDADHPCRYAPITAGAFLAGRIDGSILVGS